MYFNPISPSETFGVDTFNSRFQALSEAIEDNLFPKQNRVATSAPTANDDSSDGYAVGSRWLDLLRATEYVCVDASVGAAVWRSTTARAGNAHVRLSLQSGTPVSTADQTAKTEVRLVPYGGNTIPLWNGQQFVDLEFSETALSLSGLAADTNFDVFAYDDGGTLDGEFVAWASSSARATGITLLDGHYVKSGANDRLYLGTIRTTGTIGQCEDSFAKRLVWNNYNRITRLARFISGSSHTYATAAYRPWNNDTASRVEAVIGVVADSITTMIYGYVTAGTEARLGRGINSTSVIGVFPTTRTTYTGSSGIAAVSDFIPSLGHTSIYLLELSNGTSTFTEAYLGAVLRG